MEYSSRRRRCFTGAGAMPATSASPVERLDLFLNANSSAVTQSLFWTEARIERDGWGVGCRVWLDDRLSSILQNVACFRLIIRVIKKLDRMDSLQSE